VATIRFFICEDKKMVNSKVVKIMMAALGLAACCAVSPSAAGQDYASVTNFPNPFNSREGSTTICYVLASESEVKAKIYDLLGNLVREYPSRIEASGIKTVVWDGTDQYGAKVSKGGYILAVEIKNGSSNTLATRKIGVIH
jgi:type IV pilus biogenesis protein CpaD/CtpE